MAIPAGRSPERAIPTASDALSSEDTPEVDVSVVLPVHNESEALRVLYKRLRDVLMSTRYSYEIIVVDDGSTDDSLSVLLELRAQDSHVRIVELSRNFGHQAALGAGLDHARGRAVITLDADLQHPPEVIGELLARWAEGYDIVYTMREGDPWSLKSGASNAFYRMFKQLSGLDMRSGAADFRLMDRRVLIATAGARERYVFLRGFVTWIGFRQVGIRYEVNPRAAGISKYNWTRMLGFALEGLLSYSDLPLRAATALGLLCAMAGAAYATFVLYSAIFTHNVLPGWTSTVITTLILGGTQLLMLGLVGEYLRRVYHDVKGRPSYLVRNRWGFDGSDNRT
jgi:glycosyltransferase involved in cell wall biosynthesis